MPGARLTFPLVPRRRVIGLSFGTMRSLRRGSGYGRRGLATVPARRRHGLDRLGGIGAALDGAGERRVRRPRALRRGGAEGGDRLRPSSADVVLRAPAAVARQAAAPCGTVVELILASAGAAGGFVGYLDYADGDPHWRQPKGERKMIEMRDPAPLVVRSSGARRTGSSARSTTSRRTRARSRRARSSSCSPTSSPRRPGSLAHRGRASLGHRPGRDPGSDVGAELSGRQRDRRPTPRSAHRPGHAGPASQEGGR